MMTRVALAAALVLAGYGLAGCDDGPSCQPMKSYPPTGSGAIISGSGLATDAVTERVAVSPDRQFLEYTFTRNGTTMTARYALSETPRPLPLYFVTIRRTPPHGDCAVVAGRGPVIDAVEVKRGGVVIGAGDPFFATAACGQQVDTQSLDALAAPPDGIGVALAGNRIGWAVGERKTLVSGDTVTVTILDGAGERFDVYGSWDQTGSDVKLGTLTGTGTLTVP